MAMHWLVLVIDITAYLTASWTTAWFYCRAIGEVVHGHSGIPKVALGTVGASLECLECDDNGAPSVVVYDRKNVCLVVSVYPGPVLSTVMTSSSKSKMAAKN